ncbi:3-deoxy-manno-octulosonate cytidylyltransferase [Nesterenkonia sp. MY13]|uniref:3-deoxy-manno-octulosonate cytidylyltransferase n=1 Tax=Nesterenkonia sedimenti TaxID=1463632 RepID=A0A7X8TLN2_9MICC|nr:3-deoxy-manno-octulosonate cytidylyltransferase [Nesterenkonia sedimenti]NLS11052.1 3-deoxy-manno-octulosonate cytidylyltransferase [Nesterenkonia sedimenti]
MAFRGHKVIAMVPSRLESTRLPRKALADICGLPMVIHVLRRVQMSPIVDEVYIATDSEEIKSLVESYGGNAIMTSSEHTTGIERISEASADMDYDVICLINGDEPALNPDHIQSSVEALLDSEGPTSLLASESTKVNSPSDFKVVTNLAGEAMYFSREDIPSPSRSGVTQFLKAYHLISFRKGALDDYMALEKTPLEALEGHDHLRFLENGYKVQIGVVEHDSFSVDTPENLIEMVEQMKGDALFEQYRHEASAPEQPRDAVAEHRWTSTPITAVVPCRAGSERVKDKNTRPFAGFEGGLLELKLKQLVNVPEIDNIIVSTNDPVVMDFTRKFAETTDKPITINERPDDLADSSTPMSKFIQYAAELQDEGIMMMTHVTHPLVTATTFSDLIAAWREAEEQGYDSLVTATRLHAFLWDAAAKPFNYDDSKEKWPRSQDIDPLFEINHAAYLMPFVRMREVGDRVGTNPRIFEMDQDVAMDIDWEHQFHLLEDIVTAKRQRGLELL